MKPNPRPILLQGGMGVGVSAWQLGKTDLRTGQRGVVVGTALEAVHVRRLQCGDPGGHIRRDFLEFPVPRMAKRILDRYFLPKRKPSSARFATMKLLDEQPSQEQRERIALANLAEVFFAKEATAVGRKCICNGLMAKRGLGQVRASGTCELPLVNSRNYDKNLSQVKAQQLIPAY